MLSVKKNIAAVVCRIYLRPEILETQRKRKESTWRQHAYNTGIAAQGNLFQIPKERFDTDHINKLYFYAEMTTSQPAKPDLQGFYINYIHGGAGTL